MRHHTYRLRFRHDEGQAIVEFAIVLPVLVLLIFGITQFAARVPELHRDHRRCAGRRARGRRQADNRPLRSRHHRDSEHRLGRPVEQDLEPHHVCRRRECRRSGLDHDPVPVLDRPARRQHLGQPHCEREREDGMKALSARLGCESGQVFVFVAFILIALVGMAALVIDVGSWFHAQRKLQTAADAAALAGAQHLPTQQSTALAVALDYAQRNDAGIPAPTVTFPNTSDDPRRRQGRHARHLRPGAQQRVRRRHRSRHRGGASQCSAQPEERRADRRQEHGSVHVLNPSCYRPDDHPEASTTAPSVRARSGLIDLRCQSSSSSVSCGGGPAVRRWRTGFAGAVLVGDVAVESLVRRQDRRDDRADQAAGSRRCGPRGPALLPGLRHNECSGSGYASTSSAGPPS